METYKNPWKTLLPYEVNDECSFSGRNDDIARLFSLIEFNSIVTLYGKSGVGKTSLLKAGVFPLLEKEGYLPIIIRLGNYIDDIRTYSEIVFSNISCNVKGDFDFSSKQIFSQIFKDTSFFGDDNNNLTPVFIFDQFEEVLYSENTERVELLLQQVVEWKNCDDLVATDCHFVISIREDDLFLLEDLIDRHKLNSLKRFRYRLLGISFECAKEIIQIPGKQYISDESVIDKVLELAAPKQGFYEVAELSLLCSQLYEKMYSSGGVSITLDLVQKEGDSSILEYYKNAIVALNLNDDEIRILEKEFITDSGRRNFVSEYYFNKLFLSEKKRKELIEGRYKLLSCINGRVELIHDLLAKAITKSRDQHLIQLENQQKMICNLFTSLHIVFVFVLLVFQLLQLNTNLGLSVNKLMFPPREFSVTDTAIIIFLLANLISIILLLIVGFGAIKRIKEIKTISIFNLCLSLILCVISCCGFLHDVTISQQIINVVMCLLLIIYTIIVSFKIFKNDN